MGLVLCLFVLFYGDVWWWSVGDVVVGVGYGVGVGYVGFDIEYWGVVE